MERTSLLYHHNGTPQVVNIESSSPVAEAVIIIICYLFGVGYNLIIIITILHTHSLRTCSFYIMLLQVCISCLLDCLTTESIAFSFLLSEAPSCGFSAIVFHLFLLVHSSSIGLVVLERTLSLKIKPLPGKAALGGILVSSVFGFIFVSPSLWMAEVHYFPNRNACSAVKTNMWFSILSLIGFILLWGLIVICVVELVSHLKKHLNQRNQLDILSVFPSSSNEILNNVSTVAYCTKDKTTSMVLFLYSVLLLPLTISFSSTLFLTPMFEPNPWIDPRSQSNKTRSAMTNSLEPLFVYSRYMYNALVPIIVLSSDREVRMQSNQMFCSKRNVISSFDQSIISNQTMAQETQSEPVSLCSLKTPVLFATSRGIHLRSQNVQNRLRESVSDSKSRVRLVRTFCDVTINSTVGVEEREAGSSCYNESRPRDRRCVRFSSQVGAISAPDSILSGYTRTLTTPLYVKGHNEYTDPGNTYTKM